MAARCRRWQPKPRNQARCASERGRAWSADSATAEMLSRRGNRTAPATSPTAKTAAAIQKPYVMACAVSDTRCAGSACGSSWARITEPMTATPRVPPSWRTVWTMPEACGRALACDPAERVGVDRGEDQAESESGQGHARNLGDVGDVGQRECPDDRADGGDAQAGQERWPGAGPVVPATGDLGPDHERQDQRQGREPGLDRAVAEQVLRIQRGVQRHRQHPELRREQHEDVAQEGSLQEQPDVDERIALQHRGPHEDRERRQAGAEDAERARARSSPSRRTAAGRRPWHRSRRRAAHSGRG